jgi:hypothetical protein
MRIEPNGEQKVDIISLKGYKYGKKFDTYLSNTCPCVPRYHSTFGRPTLYEEVSQELQNREQDSKRWKRDAAPIVAYKDRLIFRKDTKNIVESEITVLDEHGIMIVYQESINDMLMIEEEMIKIGSYFLNKEELAHHIGG